MTCPAWNANGVLKITAVELWANRQANADRAAITKLTTRVNMGTSNLDFLLELPEPADDRLPFRSALHWRRLPSLLVSCAD
jgi:hypothetical protein